MQRKRVIVIGIVAVVALGAVLAAFIGNQMYFNANYYVVENNEYNDPPPARDDFELADDSLTESNCSNSFPIAAQLDQFIHQELCRVDRLEISAIKVRGDIEFHEAMRDIGVREFRAVREELAGFNF
jgi:hypothetical protein